MSGMKRSLQLNPRSSLPGPFHLLPYRQGAPGDLTSQDDIAVRKARAVWRAASTLSAGKEGPERGDGPPQVSWNWMIETE
jgi:hypothetical protein